MLTMPGPDGSMMQHPFNGNSLTGYDNQKQKYVNLWMDDMSTSVMIVSTLVCANATDANSPASASIAVARTAHAAPFRRELLVDRRFIPLGRMRK